MISRQPKIHFGFRIAAAVTAVFWLMATSYCGLEHLLGCDDHGVAASAEETAHLAAGFSHSDHQQTVALSHDAAEAPHDAEGQSQRSHHHHDGGEASCCSTLHATVQITQPIVISKPLLQPLTALSDLAKAQAGAINELAEASDRPPPNPDQVFTPEVCTGPANRSHAPPASV